MTKSKKILILILPIIVIGYFAYSSFIQDDSTDSSSDNTQSSVSSEADLQNSVSTKVSTLTAIKDAAWASGVAITFDDNANKFQFQSNGIPDHGFAEQYLIPNDISSQPFSDNSLDQFTIVNSSEYFTESNVESDITTMPTYSAEITETSLGRIGVMISGAQLFNDYEDMELTIVALDDNAVHDHAVFIDDCNGHTLQAGNDYHYHGIPTCITDVVDVAGQHSTMIGILGDGFPVYGNKDASGTVITNDDLDECSGHFGATPEFTDSIYHYHLTADGAPYSIDCYHGEIDITATNQMGSGPGGPGGPPEQR